MPCYHINIKTPRTKQTFITEDIDDETVIKTRLKGFVDACLPLIDYTLHISPILAPGQRGAPREVEREVECLYEAGIVCPLGNDQSRHSCLHCEGRGE